MVIPKDNVFDCTLSHKNMSYNCTYLDIQTNKRTIYMFFMDVTILGGHILYKSRKILFEGFMMKGSHKLILGKM